MRLHEPELQYLDSAWKSITSGHVEDLARFDVSIDDIKKMQEFYKFRRSMKRDRHNGALVISLEDASKLLSYFRYFNLECGMENKQVWVMYRSESGYEARDDVYRWYIREQFTCEKCGKIARPFYKECDDCISTKKITVFDPVI